MAFIQWQMLNGKCQMASDIESKTSVTMLLLSQLFLYPLVYCKNRFCIRHTFPNIATKNNKKMKLELVVLVIITLFFAVGKSKNTKPKYALTDNPEDRRNTYYCQFCYCTNSACTRDCPSCIGPVPANPGRGEIFDLYFDKYQG